VFLDPPYDFTAYQQLLEAVFSSLAESSPEHLVLLEVSRKTGDEVVGEAYEVRRRIRASGSHVLMLRPRTDWKSESMATARGE